jgi:membrane-associated phospholipid phosphatase
MVGRMHAFLRRAVRVVALTAAALGVGTLSSSEEGHELDASAFRAVNAGHGPAADLAFSSVTELGSLYASCAAALALAAFGHRGTAARAFTAACATWGAGQILKREVGRPRPYELYPGGTRRMIGRPPQSSWPSSHPAVLTAFVTVAGRGLGLSPGVRRGLLGLPVAVAVSRVYLGVHYPSDVASGVLLGRAVGELASPDR